MVYVSAGEFIMGPYLAEETSSITSLDAFYIDKYETTVADYITFLNAQNILSWDCDADCIRSQIIVQNDLVGLVIDKGRFHAVPGFEQRPVAAIDWGSANMYCKWQGKRLPDESEWEKAARGTDGLRYPWGNEWDPTYAAGSMGTDASRFPAPVGSHLDDVSPYGVYDMLGNVTEWVHNQRLDGIAFIEPQNNPYGAGGRFSNVRRGAIGGDAINGLMVRSNGLSQSVGVRCAYSADD